MRLSEIYAPGLLYTGMPHPETSRWLPAGATARANMTGGQITVAGDLPLLCAAGCCRPDWLDVVGEAGLQVATSLRHYADFADGLGQLREWIADARRVVLQHRWPDTAIPAHACWIDPELLSWLNDKANLPELVPAEALAERSVFSAQETSWNPLRLPYPFFLKVATEQSSGGGEMDLMLCRHASALRAARDKLAGSGRLVQEAWQAVAAWHCVNYAVLPDGRVAHLGTAEVNSTADGAYRGNWIGDAIGLPETAIAAGLAVARAGAARGYRGILGIDMGMLADGRLRMIDLNFRLCGSTAALLLWPELRARTGAALGALCALRSGADYRRLLRQARSAIRDGYFVPLSSYDPGSLGSADPCRIGGLVLGASRAEVEAARGHLLRMGWR